MIFSTVLHQSEIIYLSLNRSRLLQFHPFGSSNSQKLIRFLQDFTFCIEQIARVTINSDEWPTCESTYLTKRDLPTLLIFIFVFNVSRFVHKQCRRMRHCRRFSVTDTIETTYFWPFRIPMCKRNFESRDFFRVEDSETPRQRLR